MRIGLLHHGNEQCVWGSVVTTCYLKKAFERLGHDVWRISVTEHQDYPSLLNKKTDLIICEGVPEWQVPKGVWDTSNKKIFWWLSDLFYDVNTVSQSNFDAIAGNSNDYLIVLKNGKPACRIDLGVDKDLYKSRSKICYHSDITYVGSYPHKSQEQMDVMFHSCACAATFTLWGSGWQNSSYSRYYKGILPLFDIGNLYNSVKYSIFLTEEKQKKRGMINNRVYEALSCGCLGISEPYEYLEKLDLAEYILFSHDVEEIQTYIKKYNEPCFIKKRELANRLVIEKYNYDIRAKQFIKLYNSL